jgi:hypothetical protein
MPASVKVAIAFYVVCGSHGHACVSDVVINVVVVAAMLQPIVCSHFVV